MSKTLAKEGTQPPERETAPCDCGRDGAIKKKLFFGIPGSNRWLLCEACVQEARQADEEERADQVRAAKEAKRVERASSIGRLLDRMGVTRKYQGVTLDNFDPSHDGKALAAAREWLTAYRAGRRESLYLYSSRPGEAIAPGTGKTHLSVSILRELVLDPDVDLADVAFAFVPRMLLEIQSTFKHPERSELSIVKRYAKPEVLVWDDFGAEKLSDYAARTLYTILYEREGKSNIFTSNLSLIDIEERDPSGYTQRITSRIAGEARIVRMSGPDRRLRPRVA